MSNSIDSSVRTGVLGVGSMGRHHTRVYQELRNTELVGITDIDQDRAREIADRYDTTALSQETLLDSVDAVSIAVPTRYHHETALTAIEAGVHLLVEKPFVVDPVNGREIIERASENDLRLQVGHVERFNPAVVELDTIISDLDVVAIRADRLGPPVDRENQVSTALDLMIHDIDVMMSVFDADISSVAAEGTLNNKYVDATVTFDDDTIGKLTASRVTQERVRKLSVTAKECKLNLDYVGQSIEIHRQSLPEYVENDGSLRYRHESITERPTIRNGEPLKAELEAFAEAVAQGDDPPVTGEDGLRAIKVAKHIDKVAREPHERRVQLQS